MACAKLSERFLLSSGRSIPAGSLRNSRVRHVAPVKPLPSPVPVSSLKLLPDGNPFELVVVSDRPRPFSKVSVGASAQEVTNCACTHGHIATTHSYPLCMNDSISKLDGHESLEERSRVSSRVVSFHCTGNHHFVLPTVVSTIVGSKNAEVLYLHTHRQSHLMKITPTTSIQSSPSQDEEDQSPSPAQLSFILLKLRDEVCIIF